MTHRPLAQESVADPRMLAEVADGLSRPQKELSPKYFYDQRGSELFEEITRLEEYYPTRTERAMLEAWMPSLIRAARHAARWSSWARVARRRAGSSSMRCATPGRPGCTCRST